MFEMEIKKYKALNELAEKEGIVIFGGAEDAGIPLGELKQAFAIEENIYNRSIHGLSVEHALELYDACVKQLVPETLLLHIGEADLKLFKEDMSEFTRKYSEFVMHIKSQNKTCRIVIVSLRNYDSNPVIAELNKQLKYIADTQCCEYENIANRRVWNPKNTKDTVSFVYSLGFVRPLKNKRPLYDLIKIFFVDNTFNC